MINRSLYILVFLVLIQNSFSQTLNVLNFGAKPDGKTMNTQAIQKAIDEAFKSKKATLVFPKGKYLTGSLILKSGVTLLLEEGSVILGSINPDDYKKIDIKDAPVSPKADDNSKLSLILAYNAKDVGIIGKGTIDGQGRELALYIDSLHHMGIKVDPNYRTRPSETMRPKLTIFMDCENVNISGITVKNASCWVMTYELCKNVIIDQVKIKSRAYWNNDGMDITDCKNVKITDCYVDAADDGICLKSYYPGHFNDSIYIANCSIRSSASAVKFGTASWGGFRNVVIENIKVKDTYRSVIAIESVDGGFIENVMVSNIVAENTGNAIFVRLGHRAGEKPGTIKNIVLKNIKVKVPFGRPDEAYDMRGPELPFFHNQFPSSICGIPGSCIENISLENIEISYPGRASKAMGYIPLWRLNSVPENIKNYPEYTMFGELPAWGFYIRHVKGISMKNIILKLEDPDYRCAYVFDDVQGIKMEKIQLARDKKEQIILKDTKEESFDKNAQMLIKIINN
jgi:hypothetical protein